MKFRIISPAIVTGGPELLHQLCAELSGLGFDAAMCYTPFGEQLETPEAFSKYNVSQAEFEDSDDVVFIIPESRTGLIEYINHAQSMIWWLSVNNYTARKPFNYDRGTRRTPLNRGLRHRIPLDRLKNYDLVHLSQSHYSTDFLARHGIPSLPLGDYVNEEFLQNSDLRVEVKTDTIAYNPKKGLRQTRMLMKRWPEFEWVPLVDLTRLEMLERLRTTKLYVDFGAHPGKDRIPREAAISGACVLTGLEGSAANPIDVSIPRKYKFDHRHPDFSDNFGAIVQDIFKNYQVHCDAFEPYRTNIKREHEEFRLQTRALFEGLSFSKESA